MKISSLIIGIVIVGLFASVFGSYYANIGTQYSQDFNETAFSSYDKINNTIEQIELIEDGLDEEKTQEGITDLIGGFLKKGFVVLKVTFASFGLINDMTDDAITQLDDKTGGGSFTVFKTAILAIVGILFLFLIISVLVGREI